MLHQLSNVTEPRTPVSGVFEFFLRRVVFVAACLTLGACHKESNKGIRPDPELVRYLPPNPALLAGVNVASLKASAFYKRHPDVLQNLPVGKADYDVSEALLTWQRGQLAAVVRGHISPGTDRFARPKPDIVVLGTNEVKTGGNVPPALKARLDLIPNSDQIWIASSAGIPSDIGVMRSDVQSALSNVVNNIRSFSVGVGVDEGLHLHSDLGCDSEAGAKRVHDAFRGMIGMGRLMTRDDQRDMLKLYDAVQVDQDQATVRVHADLPREQADQLVQLINQTTNLRR
jgi:hypothetical protein